MFVSFLYMFWGDCVPIIRRSSRNKVPDVLDVRHYKGGGSSAVCTGRLYHRRNPWYSFSEAKSTPGHMVPSGATEKIPSDTTGNGSQDLPTSSADHQEKEL
jgi:hypothetical protein